MILAWMVYAILIAAFLGGAALAAEWALRAYRTPTRWLWLAAILLSVVGPVIALRGPGEPDPVVARTEALAAESAEAGPSYLTMPTAILRLDDPSRFARLDRPLVLAWLVASLLLALRFGVSLAVLARRRRDWRIDEVDDIPVRIAPDLGPAVVGFLAPAIVLPEWIRTLDRRLLRLVVAHEREHVREWDSRIMVAAGALVALLPWNLPLWWQIRRLRLAVEIDCDRRVLAGSGEIAPYAGLLCEIGAMSRRSRAESIPLGQSGLIRPTAFLERRIRHMTAPVPHHRPWKALGVGILAIALLGVSSLPDPPSAPEGGSQQEYHLLAADIEYREARSMTELPSVYVIEPAHDDRPERRWLETFEAYENMAIVDRRVITPEEFCYTTREQDGSVQLHTRPTAPEIDSLSASAGYDSGEAISRFLSERHGGKAVEFMTYTREPAVCFLLRGETGPIAAETGALPPSDDARDLPSEDSEGDASRDTIDYFRSTPFAQHPVCLEVCSVGPFFAKHVGSASCDLTVGIRVDKRGFVTHVDMLQHGASAGCDEAAEEWARSTRWRPARNASGRTIPVWIAQPISYYPVEEA